MAAPKPRTRLGLGLAAMAVGMALLPLPTGRYIVLGGERREGRGLRDYLPKWYAMTGSAIFSLCFFLSADLRERGGKRSKGVAGRGRGCLFGACVVLRGTTLQYLLST
eukprot:658248-Amorphochlora_amoeboformis.AAC.1